jgi:hypothetical protein
LFLGWHLKFRTVHSCDNEINILKMVYLTMTSTIVEALEKIQSLQRSADENDELRNEKIVESLLREDNEEAALETQLGEQEKTCATGFLGDESLKEETAKSSKKSTADGLGRVEEPSLSSPKRGNPISHGQAIELSRKLKAQNLSPRSLDVLLRGARVYVAPPPPKPEPVGILSHFFTNTNNMLTLLSQTSEYKALMASLRREEEARSYERMTNPPPPMETFAQRFPMSSATHAFPSYQEREPEDEVTYADINRQMALIFNVLLSIVACAGAIWVAARWWSTPARLALSMSGSLLVGIAEVVVYGGYIRRVSEAKGKQKGVPEVREVLRTWVVGGADQEEGEETEKSVLIKDERESDDVKTRRRKKEMS